MDRICYWYFWSDDFFLFFGLGDLVDGGVSNLNGKSKFFFGEFYLEFFMVSNILFIGGLLVRRLVFRNCVKVFIFCFLIVY